MVHFNADSIDATLDLARRLGRLLFAGSVVALEGTLGVGKTHFVRGVAEGLEIADSRIVSSPTFVLIHEYAARLPIYHFDAYRLSTLAEFFDLGVHEYFHADGVCLIEWADKVSAVLPQEHVWVRLEIVGPTARRISIEGCGQRHEEVAAGLLAG